MTRTRLVIYGAAGRMGQSVVRAALERSDIELVAALVRSDSSLLGDPLADVFGAQAPDLEFTAALDPDVEADVLIDFTGVRAFDAALALAQARGLPLVSGTTGLSDAQVDALRAMAEQLPVLWSANFSIGVAVLKRLSVLAAGALGPEFDVEILEAHHRYKQDAPSGTALAIGRAIAESRGSTLDELARFSREGQVGPRREGEIGFAVQRAADIIGEHTVLFAAPGERIEITHRAGSRAVFAQGAVRAAVWLAQQRPGYYELADAVA